MSYQEYRNDLNRCQQLIAHHTGVQPRFHRPPRGQLTIPTLLAPIGLGLTTMTWSCSAEDWRFRSDSAAIARADEMISEVRPRDVLLFHDERSHTLLALDRLLPALRSRGFSLCPSLEHAL
jgi:peptidoglycan/xylan/chitin deacetylase (PgdA/CDA1 family)